MMMVLWRRQKATRNAGIVDVAWSFGTGVAGAWLALSAFDDMPEFEPRQWLVAGLVTFWAVRLGIFVFARGFRGREDARYRAFRERHRHRAQARLFHLFQYNAMAALFFAIPIMVAAHNPTLELTIFDWIGTAIWFVAVVGESFADRTLTRFKANPENARKVCDAGFWRYSRHPNYFFEWLHWFAYVAIAVPVGVEYRWAWATLAGPIVMYFVVTQMTGVPPTERHLLASRGDAYRAYQARTNVFFPGPRRV